MKRHLTYTIILQPETDPEFVGYYNASVPALPGCFSYGENRETALQNIREAINLYLDDLATAGELIPEDHIEQVRVEIAA
jgi:antitoxin HicB